MVMTSTNGNITSTSSEGTLFDITASSVATFITTISTHNMTSSDTVVIRVYYRDANSNVLRLFDSITLSGDQPADLQYVDPIACTRYKVTIQRTAGSDRVYTWERIEIT